jgi:hypothetical protein
VVSYLLTVGRQDRGHWTQLLIEHTHDGQVFRAESIKGTNEHVYVQYDSRIRESDGEFCDPTLRIGCDAVADSLWTLELS